MFGFLLLIGSLGVGEAQAAAGEDLGREVRRLARQLNSPQLAQREAAERELIQMGPDILGQLPPLTDRTPAEVKQRLQRIRQQLQFVLAESVASPSQVSLAGDQIPLSEILVALQRQSGNKIVDYRRQRGDQVTDPKLSVKFDKTPFWPALDHVLDEAGLAVYAFSQDRGIHVVARGESQLPSAGRVSYSGPFRFEPVRVMALRDLRVPQSESLRLTMEISWEPRLQPISLTQKLADLTAADENGNPLQVSSAAGELEIAVAGRKSAELTLPLALPPRDVARIASLKGRLTALLPGKIETFTFGDLATAKNVAQRIAGVTVILDQVRKNRQTWEFALRVRFDEAGEALQSHRGWFLDNEACLEGPDGKPIPHDVEQITGQSRNEIGMIYGFVLDDLPSEHKFVYKTPGLIVAKAFSYEIKDVKLP